MGGTTVLGATLIGGELTGNQTLFTFNIKCMVCNLWIMCLWIPQKLLPFDTQWWSDGVKCIRNIFGLFTNEKHECKKSSPRSPTSIYNNVTHETIDSLETETVYFKNRWPPVNAFIKDVYLTTTCWDGVVSKQVPDYGPGMLHTKQRKIVNIEFSRKLLQTILLWPKVPLSSFLFCINNGLKIWKDQSITPQSL